MSKTTQEKKAKLAKEKINVEETEKKTPSREAAEVTETPETEAVETPVEETATVKKIKIHGKKYQKAKAKVDVNKFYPLKEAVELVKDTSFSKFEGKVEAHITTYDIGNVGEISFPHMEAADKKIVVLNDTVLADIKEGKLDFDILIATPATMPKLLPFAKVLGPKGLMPNPKNGTLTDKPEESVKRLAVAKTAIKTEKKAPVIHIIVGKVNQPIEELMENIDELIKIVKPTKIKKLALCATMGPSVKVVIQK